MRLVADDALTLLLKLCIKNKHRERKMQVNQAMILAAGMGKRMGELTQEIPKPMLIVEGISLIERALLYLKRNNINKVVINTHYKAEIFEEFVMSLPIAAELEIFFSREEILLGTGGGIKHALPLLGKEPFFVINSDAVFIDSKDKLTSFMQLQENWQSKIMPMMMLLARKNKAFGYWSKGDFDINEHNQLNQDQEIREFINPGLSVMDYRLFADYQEEVLQFSPTIYQDLIQKHKLYGSIYEGNWYHIGDTKAYYEKPMFS